MAKIIGSVKVTPPKAAPGQSVLVQVLDSAGRPFTTESDVVIALDGIPVPSRYYQFPTAGPRTITVYAAGHGTTETTTVTVHITGPPLVYHRTLFPPALPTAPGLIPFIVLTQDLTTPYQVRFSLATPPAAAAAAARALATAQQASVDKPASPADAAQEAPAGFLALQALFTAKAAGPTAARGQHLALERPVTLPPPGTSYVWAFGDGQTETTDTPSVVHDYFPAIAPGRVAFAFDVQCLIVHDSISVARTLVLYSTYGMCQRNGVTVPNVTGDVYASLNSDRTLFLATLLVRNIEATTMTIDQVAIVPAWNDPSASFPAFAFKRMAQPVTIAPHSSSMVTVQVPRSDLSSAAKGAAVTGFIIGFQGTLAYPVTLPSIDVALLNELRPGRIAFSTVVPSLVRFSRHVRLQLQDQQLPPTAPHVFRANQPLIDNISKATAMTDPVVRNGGVVIDPATNIVSVGLTTPVPTATQMAQVRYSVLSVLQAAVVAGGMR